MKVLKIILHDLIWLIKGFFGICAFLFMFFGPAIAQGQNVGSYYWLIYVVYVFVVWAVTIGLRIQEEKDK